MLCSTRIVPPSEVIGAFEELVDNDDLPQGLISYFETHYIGGVRGRDPRRRRVAPTFVVDIMWNGFEGTLNNLPNTNNSVEGLITPYKVLSQTPTQIFGN